MDMKKLVQEAEDFHSDPKTKERIYAVSDAILDAIKAEKEKHPSADDSASIVIALDALCLVTAGVLALPSSPVLADMMLKLYIIKLQRNTLANIKDLLDERTKETPKNG